HDRTKNFFLRNTHLIIDVDKYRRFHEPAVLVLPLIQAMAAANQFRAFVLADLHIAEIGLLNALIASEIETAAGKHHHDSAISPANYTLDLLGEQQVGPYRCFAVQAVPN